MVYEPFSEGTMVISLISNQQDCKGEFGQERNRYYSQRRLFPSWIPARFPSRLPLLLISCVQNLTSNLGVQMSVRMPISPSRKLASNELGSLSQWPTGTRKSNVSNDLVANDRFLIFCRIFWYSLMSIFLSIPTFIFVFNLCSW